VPSTAFRNACNIAQPAATGFHIFHRTWLSSRLKISIETIRKDRIESFHTFLPPNKAGTEKNIRSVKEEQSKHKKRIVPRPRRVNRQQTKRPPGNSGGLFFKGE